MLRIYLVTYQVLLRKYLGLSTTQQVSQDLLRFYLGITQNLLVLRNHLAITQELLWTYLAVLESTQILLRRYLGITYQELLRNYLVVESAQILLRRYLGITYQELLRNYLGITQDDLAYLGIYEKVPVKVSVKAPQKDLLRIQDCTQ